MGKTLTSLLTIGAAIAVNAIPGVGQVISGAIVGGLGGTFAAVGVASTVLGVLSTGLTVAALSSAAGLLGLTPGAPKSDTASTSVKTSRPPRVSAYGAMRLYGAYILYETGSNGAAIDGYAVHDGMMTAPIAFYIGDDKVTWKSGVTYPGGLINGLDDGKMGDDTTRFYYTDGRTPGTVIPVIVNDLPGVWSNNHRGDGVCLIYTRFASVKSKNFAKRYPFGQPPPASMAAQWQKCPDAYAADPTDPTGWTWTENVVRHLLHYKIVRENVDYATKIAPTIAFWRAAQSVADEAVPLKAGGTEPRYRSCISHQHTQRHADVISTMLTACDGWLATRQDGALVIYAGKYYAPTISIGPEHIVSYEWNGVGVDDDDAVNELVCSYISADHDYNSVETTAWRDEDDIAERGQILSNNLDIQTPSWGQVRRLAKRQMARTNALYRGTVTTNVAGRIARGQRYINLLLREAGTTFYNGPAEITAVTRNMETGGITFSWVAADPNIDTWNPATEEGEPAALGDRVAPEPLATPSISAVNLIYEQSSDDGYGVRLSVVANGPDRSDLTWYLRWRTVGAPSWNEQRYDDIDPGASVTLVTSFVPSNSNLEVEVCYATGDGNLSAYSPPFTVSTATDTTAPDAATSITLTNWSDTLDLVTDLIPRATAYRWRIYRADGTTLVRTIVTGSRSVSYTSQQAAVDIPSRSYVVSVAGLNGAGEGAGVSSAVLTLPAPPAVTGVSATGGASNATVSFDLQSSVAGYSVAYSTISSFDPLNQGAIQRSLTSPTYLQNLAAGTFYSKVAAYDGWTDRPDLLNYSSPEQSFVITTGGGGGGSGGGGGGGGYCVTLDAMILMADGSQKSAGSLEVGDLLWTQEEVDGRPGPWGAFAVSAITIVEADDVYFAQVGIGLKGTANHRVWISGWKMLKDIGVPVAGEKVAKITVDKAHTYVSNGVLSHNAKQQVN